MYNAEDLKLLVSHFDTHIGAYKDTKNNYNEHSCRVEYIDPLLKILGWDVENSKGVAPQYREVIAENYSSKTDRPDYSMTLRGVTKFFVEAKKPGLSQILCNHREVVKNRVKILKGGSGASCCRLLYKITAVRGHVKGGGVSLHSS